MIVSDHGFRTVKRSIRANVMLKAKGLDGSAWVIPEGGTAMVYATRAADNGWPASLAIFAMPFGTLPAPR